MTEAAFVQQNKEQWAQYESMLDMYALYSPTELGDAYLAICSDLAFAQSHFPSTHVCAHLNALTLQFHHILYRTQPHRWSQLWDFLSHRVVLSFYHSRRYLLFAALLMLLGYMMGMASQHIDSDYFIYFFGIDYYEETCRNISMGYPMGIYGGEDADEMFLSIATNNVTVALLMFIRGLLTPFFVVYHTVETGIMLGCFDMFFFQKGLAVDALIAPNEHGSLEIPAAVIASAAGMQLGTGWFFPGSKTRLRALMDSARESVIMFLATIPVFIVAAFIESFVTRYQNWPLGVRLLIVVTGLVFIGFYVVVYPHMLARKEGLR